MGCPVSTIDGVLKCLGTKNKDWCLVLLFNREYPSKVASVMINDLLSEFDEDSGDNFDFFIPGYSVEPNHIGNI
jgi:hypothetical protein